MKIRLIVIACALVALGLIGREAYSAVTGDNAACCQLTTSLAHQALQGPDLAGDERFFTGGGSPPNIHFLLDTSGSMQDIPQVLSWTPFIESGLKCGNTKLISYQDSHGWTAGVGIPSDGGTYPPPDPGVGWGDEGSQGNTNGKWDNQLNPLGIYTYGSWSNKLYQNTPPAPAYTSVADACSGLANMSTSADGGTDDVAECEACLQARGFYINPNAHAVDSDDWANWGRRRSSCWLSDGTTTAPAACWQSQTLMSGNFLRFDPPKYVTAMAALKNLLTSNSLIKIRAGISVFTSDAQGATLLQKQNPPCKNSLKGQTDSDRNSYVNDINGLCASSNLDECFNSNTPLAESLLNIGQYFSSDDTVYKNEYKIKYTKSSFTNTSNADGRSVCWGCQNSAVVIITDGYPTADTFDGDGSDVHTALEKANAGNPAADSNGVIQCPKRSDGTDSCDVVGSDDLEWLDDVAAFLHTHDLQRNTTKFNSAGDQTLTIYGIGFGLKNPLLANAAAVGGGFYRDADDAASLESALAEIINSVRTDATSFSSSAVASLQVQQASGSLIPRFVPDREGTNKPWQGYLYRFGLANELAFGCNPTDVGNYLDGGTHDTGDLNYDGVCDTTLVDQDSSGTYHGVVESDGNRDGGIFLHAADNSPAEPYWVAGESPKLGALYGDGGTQLWKVRNIYTVIDKDGDGGTSDGKYTSSDTVIPFDTAHAAELEPYLGISATDPCTDVASLYGLSSLDPLTCAKVVIAWYRGAAVKDASLSVSVDDAGVSLSLPILADVPDRAHLLGDIFHSSPVEVEPPSDKAFCDFTNQCQNTLFDSPTTMDPVQSSNPSTPDAYDEFYGDAGTRRKIVLVGANDGMLHAFDDGAFDGGYEPVTGLPVYSAGTGQELWAFVPPDLLPKMRVDLGKHAYFVDGTPMVRDAWLDYDGDNTKEPNEYRTVAVVGEGRGGVHHFALDVTDAIPEDLGTKIDLATLGHFFLWEWPQPCDEASQLVGDSFSNYAPRPPPIGAVAVEDSDGTFSVDNTKAKEDWVVFLNGGYDAHLVQGRGLAMVDLKTGDTRWSKFFGDGTALADDMTYPFAAGISMLDVGSMQGDHAVDADGFFDTATVPDLGGNVWTVRFWKPGHLDATGAVDDWFAARAFKAPSTGTVPEPFTEQTANAYDASRGAVRTFVGSGDRYHLADFGTHCRLSNAYACAQDGCGFTNTVTFERDSTQGAQVSSVYASGAFDTGTSTSGTTGPGCTLSKVSFSWAYDNSASCKPAVSSGTNSYECVAGSACSADSTNDWTQADVVNFSDDTGGGWYYGFVALTPTHVFGDGGTAVAYDDAAVTASQLTDVTADGGTASGADGGGWKLHYASSERTATGSAIAQGCVVWDSMSPSDAGVGAICSTEGSNTASLYQANFVTGAADCAAGFGGMRKLTRKVVAVPGEPAVQRGIIGGQPYLSIATLEAGNTMGTTVSQGGDFVETMSELDLTRSEHECRHEDGGVCE